MQEPFQAGGVVAMERMSATTIYFILLVLTVLMLLATESLMHNVPS
jgi:hypothetical protein